MIAKPLMLLVQGHDEQIGALNGHQQLKRAISWPSSGIDHGFAQRADGGSRIELRRNWRTSAD